MELSEYIDERVVLTTKNEVCYAGVPTKLLSMDDNPGLMITIDQGSGFSIWCPEAFIKEILIIPIPKESNA